VFWLNVSVRVLPNVSLAKPSMNACISGVFWLIHILLFDLKGFAFLFPAGSAEHLAALSGRRGATWTVPTTNTHFEKLQVSFSFHN
jgi:hypothetical protein